MSPGDPAWGARRRGRSATRRVGALALVALALGPFSARGQPPSPPRHFVYAGDADFGPYDYIDAAGRPTGFNVELVRSLAQMAGVEVEIHLGPWHKARADFDAGTADLISLSYSEDRARQYLWLAQSWTMHQCVLFPPGRRAYPTGPADLSGQVIAVQERTAVGEMLFEGPPPHPSLVSAPSQLGALDLLRRGVATGVGGNSLTLRIAAAEAGMGELVEVPLRAVPYGLMAKRGREADLEWVGKGMARLREAGAVEGLAERFLAVPPPARGLRRYVILAVWLFGGLAMLSAAVVAWNHNLRRLVALRTSALEAALRQREALAASLALSENRYKTFLALSGEGIARLELEEPLSLEAPIAEQVEHILNRARLTECNPAFYQMLQHPAPESLVGMRLGELGPAGDLASAVQLFVAQGYRLRGNEAGRLRPDGSVQWLSANAIGIVSDRHLTAVWLTQHDVTERKQSEEDLRTSEKKFRDIFEFSPVGMFQTLEDGTIVTANTAFARLLGHERPEQVEGLNTLQHVWFDPADRLEALARFVAAGDQADRTELRFRRRDGSPFWVRVTGHVIRDATGRIRHFEGFVEDINARREAEDALRASEERYRLLFDGNPVPMLVWDLETLRFLAVNTAAVEQYGYSREELLALQVTDLAIADETNRAQFLATRLDPHPPLVRVGLQRQGRKDGTVIEVDVTSLALTFAGRPGCLMLARDVTVEREGLRERERLQDSLRRSEAMSALGSLVAGVAHEVRNPLFSISATVDTLESELGPQEQYAECTQLLRSQVARLTHLMNDLLDYGKPFALRISTAHPGEVLHRAVRSCSRLAKDLGVNLVEDATADQPAIAVDAVRLEQAFQNLVANAVQHSPQGTTVRVTSSRVGGDDGWLEFCIEDDGAGLAPEDIPRLFEPFFSRRQGGTGLGLPVVQRIIEAHGGEIVAANRPNGGAVFSVKLPVRGARGR